MDDVCSRVDKFDLELPYVGPINKCHIEHDGSGAAPDWKVEKVTIEDVPRVHMYEFPCLKWLSKDKGDGFDLDLSCPNPPVVDFDVNDHRRWLDINMPHIKMPHIKMPSWGFKGKGKKPEGEIDVDAEVDIPTPGRLAIYFIFIIF